MVADAQATPVSDGAESAYCCVSMYCAFIIDVAVSSHPDVRPHSNMLAKKYRIFVKEAAKRPALELGRHSGSLSPLIGEV